MDQDKEWGRDRMRYGEDMKIVSSVFIGDQKHVPRELYSHEPKMTQNFNVTPLNLASQKQDNIDNLQFSVSLDMSKCVGEEMICPFVSFTIPKIMANSAGNSIRYCSLPAVHIIDSATLRCDSLTIEVLNTLALEVAIRRTLQATFESYANKWLGGINGQYQQFNSTEHLDQKENELMPDMACIVPLPFSLFRNEKLFPLSIAKSEMTITINLKPTSSILSYPKPILPLLNLEKITNVFFCSSFASFDKAIFNQLPYVDPDKVNNYYLLPDKTMKSKNPKVINNNFCFTLSSDLITEYMVCIHNDTFDSNNTFLGKDNEDARANWWASLLLINQEGIQKGSAISLNKMKFLEESGLNSYNVRNINDPKRFILEYGLGTNQKNSTVISCDIAFSNFPENLLLYLATWPEESFVKPEFFSSVHFKVVPFDQYETNYREDSTIKDAVMTLLHNGLFTFIGVDNVKYAFLGITNLKKSPFINDKKYDIIPSLPVDKIKYKANIFTPYKLIVHNKPFHTSYDLDDKHKISCEVYSEHFESGPEKQNSSIINLESGFYLNKNWSTQSDKFQIHKTYELTKNNVGTNGFFYTILPLNITAEIAATYLTYNDRPEEISTYFNKYKLKFNMYIIEYIFRYLKLKPNTSSSDKHITVMSTSDSKKLAESILLKETGDDGVFAGCFNFDDFKDEREDEEFDNFEAKRHQVVKRVNEEDKEELDINIGSNQSVNRFNKRLKINKLH
jgi:hypothetical protein